MEIINKTIPLQLQKEDFGFVKLQKKSKIPFEKNWQSKPYSFIEIQDWISRGYNYGILGGYGDLIIIDADTEGINTILKNKFPPTFTVKTPKQGYHFYYLCKDIKKKIVLKKGDVHYGEIISKGSQVVGPGSIHPDTGTCYIVDNDIDITGIAKEQIYSLVRDYIPSALVNEKDIHKRYDELVKEWGEPYYLNANGKVISINQSFWAGLHKLENIEFYEPNEKEFYRYNNKTGLYEEITENSIKQEISSRLLQVSREKGLKGLEQKRTNATLGQIVSHLKGIEEKKNAFIEKKKIIHLENGIIEFKQDNTADFVNFSPDFYSRNRSPILFNETAKCERFLNDFLHPALPEDDIVLLQKYIGLCLLGNNLIQRFLILDGMPGRGKSTLAIIIQKLIGLNNVSELRTKLLSERFELYRYRKKTLLIGVDVPGKFLSEKGAYVIKGLVGGDFFDAEQKGGTGSFQIRGNYCIVITSNTKLQVRFDGDIGAWRRRLLIINFEAPAPKKKIPNFADSLLRDEANGILNWALEGLALLFEDIEKHGDIYLTDKQKNIIEGLLAESDSLRCFLKDRIVNNDHSNLSATEIIEAYAEYCPDQGWTAKPITVIQRELGALMLEMFRASKVNSIKREGRNVKGFRRVGFKE